MKTVLRGMMTDSSVNEEERTVDVCFTTGEGVLRYNWERGEEFIEELEISKEAIRTERLERGLQVLDNHRQYGSIENVYGVTTSYAISNGEISGKVRFASDRRSDEVFTKVKDKVLRQVSLGYKVHKYQRFEKEGSKYPIYRAIDWEPTELSFVPVAAETMNGVRQEHDPGERFADVVEEKRTDMTQKDQKVDDKEVVDDKDKGTTRNEHEHEPKKETVSGDNRAEIRHYVEAVDAVGLDKDMAIDAFARGVSIDQFRAEVIAALAKKSEKQKVVLKSDERSDQKENERSAIERAILTRCSSYRGEIEIDDQVRQYDGASLFEIARFHLEDQGIRTRGMSRVKLASRAFMTGSDMTYIFENVANKVLMSSYEETPRTFIGLGTRTTVSDFRDKNMYRMGDAPDLKPLTDHGEYQYGKFSDSKEKYRIATYARKVAFTRQMLINDDMSALDMFPAAIGAAGSRLESDIVWGLILNYDFVRGKPANILMSDGNPLFHSSHGNVLTGTGSNVSVTGLSGLRKLGRKQKTLDGKRMNVEFTTLVGPSDLETDFEQVLTANFTAISADTTNPFTRKMSYRIEPRLDDISTQQWYAFADPRRVQTFEYAYLSGQESMFVETTVSNDIDGVTMLYRHDFGAGLPDWRGIGRADGTA